MRPLAILQRPTSRRLNQPGALPAPWKRRQLLALTWSAGRAGEPVLPGDGGPLAQTSTEQHQALVRILGEVEGASPPGSGGRSCGRCWLLGEQHSTKRWRTKNRGGVSCNSAEAAGSVTAR